MTKDEVMDYLESKGSEQTRKIYTNHGAPGNFYGVKVGDLKPIEKKEKKNQTLALELYATGNSDAQYLAGLIADASRFTKEELTSWAKNASWYMISEYAVAWNVAESPLCVELCLEWINSEDEKLQASAWAALSAYIGIVPNEEINLQTIDKLLERAEKEVHSAPNRVRYCMNGFIIAVGGGIPEYTDRCKKIGDRVGKVDVYLGKTACKVPVIRPYIENMEKRGRIGKKKKTAKC